MIEVGTTNRTRLADYGQALGAHDDVAAIMRVHQSNFSDGRVCRGCRGRGAVRARRAGDRRRRLGPAGGGGRRRAEEPAVGRLGGGRRGARLLLGRQAARRPAVRADGGPARGGGGRPRAPAGARDAHRQALAGRARGDPSCCTATRDAPWRRFRCWRCWPRTSDARSASRSAGGRRSAAARGSFAPPPRSVAATLPLLELEGPAVALDGDPETLAPSAARGRAAGDRPDPRRTRYCSTRARSPTKTLELVDRTPPCDEHGR